MTVWILLMVGVVQTNFITKTVDVDTLLFESAELCLEQAEKNRKELQNKYNRLSITCTKREVYAKGK